MPYLPHTRGDVRRMLETVGVGTLEELFVEIPQALRLQRPLQLPEPQAESDVLRELRRLAGRNTAAGDCMSFLGGGAYDHFIPSAVDQLISRSEFYTAYTPYQPEISQGTLQAIFEFQTLICQLTGLDQANASMYDGASACAEAALMAERVTGRRRVLLSAGLHPEYRQTVATYCRFLETELVEVPVDETGATDPQRLAELIDNETAAVIVGYPNFFGVIENLAGLARLAGERGALLVSATAEPVSLGLLKSPGELGADIAVGEGQSFGIPVSYGGPGVGFFAARKKFLRSMPGRLVGQTVDRAGRRGFVLTLATREQHIRREKATSNIRSNQGLCALMVTVYLALLGKQGLRQLAGQNLAKARYAKDRLAALPGVALPFSGSTFNEFVIETSRPAAELVAALAGRGILAGIDLGRYAAGDGQRLLVCVTEQNRREEVDALVESLQEVLS